MEMGRLRFVLGMDLRRHSEGAIDFAAWLVKHDVTGLASILPTCVLQKYILPQHLLYVPKSEIARHMVTAIRERLEERGMEGHFEDPAAFEAANVGEALLHQSKLFRADALIMGRRAIHAAIDPMALGRVSWHLLSDPQLPVIVVPPQLPSGGVAPGPVVVGTDLSERSVHAATFAQSIAQHTDRELHVLCVQHPEDASTPDSALPTQAVADWAAAAGLSRVRPVVEPDRDVESAILKHARRADACLIVCGLGEHHGLARLLGGGSAHRLAARATIACAVVP